MNKVNSYQFHMYGIALTQGVTAGIGKDMAYLNS